MRHLIEPTDLSVDETERIIDLALDIIAHREKYSEACKGRKLATLFYEPSTRTRLSFTSAMMELGGNVIGFSDAASSSVSKGETVADTVRVIACFADIIAMRHFKEGRTVHSLIKALSRRTGIKVILIAPEELRLPDYIRHEVCDKYGVPTVEVRTMEEVMPELDILYMTRVQKERFLDEEEFERVKDSFVLTPEKLETAKKEMVVLHPLPRVNEITRAVDNDPRAAYFRQVENGKFVRMALIYTLLQWAGERKAAPTPHLTEAYDVKRLRCQNRRCISATEDVDQLFHEIDGEPGSYRCAYCEAKLRE